MLVQFMLKNVLSFKEETVFDMTAINAYKEHEYNLIDIGTKEKFIKVAAIYGANASGKSNLHLAMRILQSIVRESINNVDNGNITAIHKYYRPFLFEQDKENSEFQIIEILGDVEYKYGFEYNADGIVSEWLYRKNKETNRNIIVFERADKKIEFGRIIKKECDMYKELIPPETLVLSLFNKLKLKTDVFTDVYQGIMDTLIVNTDFYDGRDIIDEILPKIIDNDKKELVDFLLAIDTGIKDINYVIKDKEINYFTTHIDGDGNKYTMNLFYESEGTIKSIVIFSYARVAILWDMSMFIDELNVKLHPLLLKFIIDLFYNKNSKAQLVYTTHDVTLLDKKFFRRDQIWFVQKNDVGYSELTALSDFKVRSDASFEKDYLAGVYGGIPFIKDYEVRTGE